MRAPTLHVVVVGQRPELADTVAAAIGELTAVGGDMARTTTSSTAPTGLNDPRLRLVVDRARDYLDLAGATERLVLTVAPVATEVHLDEPGVLALLVLDLAEVVAAPGDDELSDVVERCRHTLPPDVEFVPSPRTVLVHRSPGRGSYVVDSRFTVRSPPTEPWLLVADIVAMIADSVQGLGHDHLTTAPFDTALGEALAGLLTAEAGPTWGLHSYTGSVVSRLIDQLERYAARHGNPVSRGPSEHALACGALARWQLDGAPFLIVVTSGMLDEFRGTLANLRDARARGLIVSVDSSPGQWLPFQGTVHLQEDGRDVLAARRVPWVYLSDPARLADDVAEIAKLYREHTGPVVVMATKSILEITAADTAVSPVPRSLPVRVQEGGPDTARPLLELLNAGPPRVLAQCGRLGRADAELLRAIAYRSGMALADSLTAPGVVSGYRDGEWVEEYLGTLSLYGYSPRVYAYLHRDGDLRPRDQQALVFFDDPVAEVATPFSPRTLRDRLHVFQTVSRAELRAPFTDHCVVADVGSVLRAVWAGLDVDPGLLAARRAAIAADQDLVDDVAAELPLHPMTPNYFFRQLGRLLDRLISDDGYRYTGVFDVGRCGLAAVCALPRTDPGFSGWFGRALMGDALQALPAVSLSRPGNVLAFVGDGAAALVPDVVPTLVQQFVTVRRPWSGNVTVFRLVNGAHSVIRSYREALRHSDVSDQTSVLSLDHPDTVHDLGDLRLVRRWIEDIEPDALAADLTRPRTINIFSVRLSHNNDGDGLGLLSSHGWQRAQLSRLARTAAARAARQAGRDGSG
ncbi:MAG: hypothetical protein ACRDRK_04600 [Pseudonocardia sp.]